MNKDLQNEIDALIKLGQTGVHTVTRSQAFKDTGWDPFPEYDEANWILISVGGGSFEETLKHGPWSSAVILTKSPEKELEVLEDWIEESGTLDETAPFCRTESLRSGEGQECGLFLGGGDCIVFPSQEELDLFFLRKDQFLYPHGTWDRLNKEPLRKWNEENREFWKKIYEYHEK